MNVGMVFAMIFALIMIAMILVFGIGGIGNIFCLSSDAQVASTIKDLESMVEQTYVLSEGSSRVFDLVLPGDAKFCFVNTEDPGEPGAYLNPEHDWVPEEAYSTIIRERGYNLWYTQCSGRDGYKLEHLGVRDAKSFCVAGGDSLYLLNKGLYVEVSFR